MRHWKIAAALLAALALTWPAIRPVVRWADVNWFNESLSDAWAGWRHGEDWSVLRPLRANLSYRWLTDAGHPILIAHALGESGSPGQNTLEAMQRSQQAGLHILELDVWLDDTGELRCHHGPDLPGPAQPGTCTLERALEIAQRGDLWLVLDIKTDFATSGSAIIERFGMRPMVSRLIFQLYRPADVVLFDQWTTRVPLPGPIVTTYAAHRSLTHIAHHSRRIGIRAFTYPLERRAARPQKDASLVHLVHPVHDCSAVQQAREADADGFYVTRSLATQLTGNCA